MTGELENLAQFFKSLGDPTRLRILQLLIVSDKLCGSIIARKLGITPSAVSQHLRLLKSGQLVKSQRVGFHVHYQINREMVKAHQGIFKQFLKCEGAFKTCCTCPDDMFE